MEKMEHLDGFAPSKDDTEKLNEFVTWLVEHGYKGIMLIHKDDTGVTWIREEGGDDAFRHDLINSLGHIYETNEAAAIDFARGIILAAQQLQRG